MKITLKDSIYSRMNAQLAKFTFEVGILEDKPKALPKYGQTRSVAGNPSLPIQGRSDKVTLVKVAGWMDESPMFFGWLSKPFLSAKNDALLRVMDDVVRQLDKDKISASDKRRLENGMQAVVRNPIARGDYGANAPSTARQKGFNKLMFLTGEFFSSIKARLRNV